MYYVKSSQYPNIIYMANSIRKIASQGRLPPASLSRAGVAALTAAIVCGSLFQDEDCLLFLQTQQISDLWILLFCLMALKLSACQFCLPVSIKDNLIIVKKKTQISDQIVSHSKTITLHPHRCTQALCFSNCDRHSQTKTYPAPPLYNM